MGQSVGPWQRFTAWFRGAGRLAQVGVIAAVVVVACCACGGSIATISAATSGAGGSGTAGRKATATATAHGSRPTATTHTSTAQPTPTPGGPPLLGAPLADFVTAYGQPFGQGGGGSDNFYQDSAQSIIVNVTFANGAADAVGVIPTTQTWTNDEAMAECVAYLPSGASQFNQDGRFTDYHSSLGEIVLQNSGEGGCLVFTSQYGK